MPVLLEGLFLCFPDDGADFGRLSLVSCLNAPALSGGEEVGSLGLYQISPNIPVAGFCDRNSIGGASAGERILIAHDLWVYRKRRPWGNRYKVSFLFSGWIEPISECFKRTYMKKYKQCENKTDIRFVNYPSLKGGACDSSVKFRPQQAY